ncbi:MAG: preprotein translocase subunit SecG [bacterium]|jgi:preprotein translocase subunit SecG
MITTVLVLHILVSFALIAIVLLQTGKGASMGAAFGGSSQTVFGSRGPASFLHKLTTAAAVIFMLTSLGLSIYKARQERASIVTSQTQSPAPPPPAPSKAPAGR